MKKVWVEFDIVPSQHVVELEIAVFPGPIRFAVDEQGLAGLEALLRAARLTMDELKAQTAEVAP